MGIGPSELLFGVVNVHQEKNNLDAHRQNLFSWKTLGINGEPNAKKKKKRLA